MLTIKRDPHTENYTCISNGVLTDKRLSLSARGFFAAVLSLSEDWDFSVNGIARLTGVNKESVQRYLKELEAHGYLSRSGGRDPDGRFGRKCYVFDEAPSAVEPSQVSPSTEYPPTEKPLTEKPTQTNNNKTNNNKPNTKETNTDQPKVTDSSEIELQINADALRVQYGQRMTDDFIGVMAEAMNGSDRQIGGGVVSGGELRRVLSAATQEDVSNAIHATAVNSPRNHRGYFLSVLYRLAGKRLTQNAAAAPKDYSGSVWG